VLRGDPSHPIAAKRRRTGTRASRPRSSPSPLRGKIVWCNKEAMICFARMLLFVSRHFRFSEGAVMKTKDRIGLVLIVSVIFFIASIWALFGLFVVEAQELVKIDASNEADRAWLFVYYINEGHDGLFLASSGDGLVWQPINDGKPFLKPTVGNVAEKDRLMRAPSICRAENGEYHMVWMVAWESKNIGYANSKDMINWSPQKLIPVMEHEKNARNSWDPELFYDKKTKQFYIIWASTVIGKFKETANSSENEFNHRLYYTTTKDFIKFEPTKEYWDPGHNVIDPLLVKNKDGKDDQRYLLFYKDETLKPKPKKYLLMAVGETPIGPFNVQKVVSHTDWVQGPSVLKINNDWYLYYDCYGKRHFGAAKSNDLNQWTNITEKLCFPNNARQGTIIEIDSNTLKAIKERKY
jgi:hypothetical protein